MIFYDHTDIDNSLSVVSHVLINLSDQREFVNKIILLHILNILVLIMNLRFFCVLRMCFIIVINY